MPIRPVDPAKRGARPACLPTADAAPGAQPQSRLHSSSTGRIVTRARIRVRAPVPSSDDATPSDQSSPEFTKRAHHVVDRSGPNWKDGDYLVGRGRTPPASRWQKGQSGNPRGPKPREKLDPEAAFEKEVLAEFNAKVNGEEIRLNMGSFVVQLLKAGAAKGGVKAQQMLLDLFLTTIRKSVSHDSTPALETWELGVIEQLLEDYGLPPQPVFRKTDRTVDEGDSA